jgi:hypothetical protein
VSNRLVTTDKKAFGIQCIGFLFIVSIDYNEEVHSILVYIGFITVMLFLLLIIYSLINKYRKMFYVEIIPSNTRSIFIIRIDL